jgi:hypothetical protein
MKAKFFVDILPQPDDTTCGPTCLHAVYRYYGDPVRLDEVVSGVRCLEDGGTLVALLGCHALAKGYRATIYTLDLQVFDPTWFIPGGPPIQQRLARQIKSRKNPKIRFASKACLDFITLGGQIRYQDLTTGLIRRLLKQAFPIITGLSATYLYGTARERQIGEKLVYDDIQGDPTGHFVVLCGYDIHQRIAFLADPLMPNPISETHRYSVKLNRLIPAIILGSITFDANLLVIAPPKPKKGGPRVDFGRHRKP